MNVESVILALLQDKAQLASVVGLVILGVFLVGALAVLRMWFRLLREARVLEQVKARCQRLQGQGGASRTQVAAALTEDIQAPNALVCSRIYDLQAIRSKGGDINRDALAATTVARLSLGMSLPRYVSSILILFGLMGTLLGLTQAVIGLSAYQAPTATQSVGNTPAQGEGTEALRDRILRLTQVVTDLFASIEQTLSGMRTAFVASLIAITLTIVLSFVTNRVQNSLTRFLADFEDFTTKELMPLCFPPQLEGALHSLGVSLQEGVGETLKALVISLQDGTEQLATAVEEIDDRAIKAGSNLDNFFMLVQEFDTTRKRFDTSIEHLVNGQQSLVDGQKDLRQTARQLTDAVGQLSGYEAAMREVVKQLEAWQETKADLGGMATQVTSSQQSLQKTLEEFAKFSEDLFDRRVTNFLEAPQLLRQSLQTHSEATQTVLETMQARVDDLLRQQRQSTEDMGHLIETLRDNAAAQREATGTLREFMQHVGEQKQPAIWGTPAVAQLRPEALLPGSPDMWSRYMQESLRQQQQIITLLRRESPVQVWLGRLQEWWSTRQWPRFRR